jgi:hypothetical protein
MTGVDPPAVPGPAPLGPPVHPPWPSIPPAPSGPPGPPPGPGVQAPFVAPPTDGARQRRWLALGLAGAALLVCCVGGLFAGGGVVVLGNQMVLEEARGTVDSYLSAIRDRDYAAAYGLLCDRELANIDEAEFVDTYERGSRLRSFTVGDPVIAEDSASDLTVPATLSYDDGRSDQVSYLLDQDTSTGAFEVCGQRD